MSDMSCCSREWNDVRTTVDSGKKLQPLTIPRHETDNPFLADPSPLGLAQLRKSSGPDTTTADNNLHLNLAASWDAALASRTSPLASPGMGSLLRSQSEARQSPLRKYVFNLQMECLVHGVVLLGSQLYIDCADRCRSAVNVQLARCHHCASRPLNLVWAAGRNRYLRLTELCRVCFSHAINWRFSCSCYSSTGHKSEAGLPVIMPSSPTPPSPSASQVSTPPLSARLLNSPFLSEGSLAYCQCSRLSLDSSRNSRTETAHTALCNRVEAKLARARGEPLTPYLM